MKMCEALSILRKWAYVFSIDMEYAMYIPICPPNN